MGKVQVVVTVQSPNAFWNIRLAQINCTSVRVPGNCNKMASLLNAYENVAINEHEISGCNAVQPGKCLLTFWRNELPPRSLLVACAVCTLWMEAVHSSQTSLHSVTAQKIVNHVYFKEY
jgi:hypothetical protein